MPDTAIDPAAPSGLRVVVAPDEFGGTMSAQRAAQAIAAGWRVARPADTVELLPQSDGGPGFVDVLAAATGGAVQPSATTGPLGAPVTARLLRVGDTVYIESAQACGLHLIVGGPNPGTALRATTAGVGIVLAEALATGAARIVVGLGGSAATDGGRGACDVLGGLSSARDRFAGVELIAATDVTNPLLGPDGAAAVFGPQKGADARTVAELEERLLGWAHRLAAVGPPSADLPGAGAAGGLGALLLALGARRESGADVVARATGRAHRIASADLVVTGEGRYDAQTAFGKVVASVAGDARAAGVPAIVMAGQVLPGVALEGVVAAYSMVEWAGSAARSSSEPDAVLAGLSEQVAREVGGALGRRSR